jgi:hypothetical protein
MCTNIPSFNIILKETFWSWLNLLPFMFKFRNGVMAHDMISHPHILPTISNIATTILSSINAPPSISSKPPLLCIYTT